MKKKKTDNKPVADQPKRPFCSLAGQLLIAMPGISDQRFEQTVVYIYAHTEEGGAAGIVVNRPAVRTSFRDILDELHIAHEELTNPPPVLLGGPVQATRGFILHSKDYAANMTISVSDAVALTATQDILYDLARGHGPKQSLLTLGHATWIRGQLEDEIMSNVWLTTKATPEILFQRPYNSRWTDALKNLGIQPAYLSISHGKA